MKKLAILLFVALYIGTLTSNFAQNNSLLSSVSGTITNEINGDSLANISVKAFNGIEEFSTVSNNEGYYTMDISPGIYTISFEQYDYINDTISDVEITDGLDIELNTPLHPFPYPVDSVWVEYGEDSTEVFAFWTPIGDINNGLEVNRYNVYRVFGFDPYEGEYPEGAILEGIGASSSNYKQDWQVGTKPPGHYAYAVQVWYDPDTTFSNITFSENYFPLDQYYDISINVQLCCEENNTGIEINLEGLSFPFKTYQMSTDELGEANISTAVDGYYYIKIQKPGYQNLMIDSLEIRNGNTNFSYTLQENIIPPPPTSLTVDPKTSTANWNAPQQKKQSEYTVNQLDGYIVYLDGDQVAEVASTTLTYTFENLSYGRSYEALVRAKYGDSISGASVYNFESEYLKPISSVTSEYVYGNNFVPLYFIRPFGTIQSIPKGLTAFEIFNNDNLIETIEWDQTSDTIRFTQENMSAGDYVFSVKAIYNLDDYGFPGETGEALAISTENIHVVISGIADYQDNAKISIYPNPSNKNISISSEKKINEIRIIDLKGKQVLRVEKVDTEKCDVDVSVLKEGSYIVKIIIDKVVISRKLVVL